MDYRAAGAWFSFREKRPRNHPWIWLRCTYLPVRKERNPPGRFESVSYTPICIGVEFIHSVGVTLIHNELFELMKPGNRTRSLTANEWALIIYVTSCVEFCLCNGTPVFLDVHLFSFFFFFLNRWLGDKLSYGRVCHPGTMVQHENVSWYLSLERTHSNSKFKGAVSDTMLRQDAKASSTTQIRSVDNQTVNTFVIDLNNDPILIFQFEARTNIGFDSPVVCSPVGALRKPSQFLERISQFHNSTLRKASSMNCIQELLFNKKETIQCNY